MKIALGIATVILLGAIPAGAQTMGPSISVPQLFQKLPWAPPATFKATEVSGADSTYVPSRFVTFEGAVAAGRAELKEQARTVAEAATDSRETARTSTAKVHFAQDDRGRVVLSKN